MLYSTSQWPKECLDTHVTFKNVWMPLYYITKYEAKWFLFQRSRVYVSKTAQLLFRSTIHATLMLLLCYSSENVTKLFFMVKILLPKIPVTTRTITIGQAKSLLKLYANKRVPKCSLATIAVPCLTNQQNYINYYTTRCDFRKVIQVCVHWIIQLFTLQPIKPLIMNKYE